MNINFLALAIVGLAICIGLNFIQISKNLEKIKELEKQLTEQGA